MAWAHGCGGYTNHGCRCEICRAGHSAYTLKRRYERRDLLLADPTLAKHGSGSTYTNWMCRCRPCTDAWGAVRTALNQRRARERKLAELKSRIATLKGTA